MGKQNKQFYSNAEMIRHFFEKLLSDGKEHETSEIHEYIFAETGGTGADGRAITPTMISNAVREAVTAPDSMLVNIRRGYYQQKEYNAESVIVNMEKAILKAKADFGKSHVIDISKCDISDSELLDIQDAIERIGELLDQAVEVINDTHAAIFEDSDMGISMT